MSDSMLLRMYQLMLTQSVMDEQLYKAQRMVSSCCHLCVPSASDPQYILTTQQNLHGCLSGEPLFRRSLESVNRIDPLATSHIKIGLYLPATPICTHPGADIVLYDEWWRGRDSVRDLGRHGPPGHAVPAVQGGGGADVEGVHCGPVHEPVLQQLEGLEQGEANACALRLQGIECAVHFVSFSYTDASG